MTYAEKLKDPRWQRKRLEVMERDQFKCRDCDDESNSLHVHHIEYRPGADPWDYPDENFVTLCESCHATRHGKLDDEPSKAELNWIRSIDRIMFHGASRATYEQCIGIACDNYELVGSGPILNRITEKIAFEFGRDHLSVTGDFANRLNGNQKPKFNR